MKKLLVALMALQVFFVNAQNNLPPKPYGATPSERQLQWHEMERYCFLHFTVNTFTDLEWGLGGEKESVFNPSGFNADQIVSTVAKNGFKGIVLTCKHHDGFCLWPSKYTEHSVKNSPWKNGKGDVVKEISDACKKYGIKFGIYLSPWDRNSALYGTPEYITYYRNQLKELLTNYGKIFEVWLDGANGGDGYYGGANENRKIDRNTYYDWKNTWALIRQLQPNASIFSDIGPDIRWCGNEKGYVQDSCWATYTPHGANGDHPGIGNTAYKEGEIGTINGEKWIPAEVDVSIRPGWFYHEKEDTKVHTPDNLKELYFKSVGNGANWILNIPPDKTGQINAKDVQALAGLNEYLTRSFATDLLQGAKVTASETRGNGKQFSPSNLVDKNKQSYWAVNDGTTTATVTFDLKSEKEFNCLGVQEFIALGQRVNNFRIEAEVNGQWKEIFKGSTIGHKKLARFPTVKSSKIRLVIADALASPVIESVQLFKIL